MTWLTYAIVLGAGIVAAVGTGLGTVPLFWLQDVSTRLEVALWGLAGGLMASASVFGLLAETAKRNSDIALVAGGFVAGVLLVVAAHRLVDEYAGDVDATDVAQADLKTFLNVLVVLFVHSFPEGVAIGVSFAELATGVGFHVLGTTVPVLAVVIPGALAIHNMPEGLAVGIPLRDTEGVSRVEMFGAAVLTSVPQPIAAVVAFYFVRLATEFLGFGYGLAAGSMLYLVVDDVIPEGLDAGAQLADHGRRAITLGACVGVVGMAPLLLFT